MNEGIFDILFSDRIGVSVTTLSDPFGWRGFHIALRRSAEPSQIGWEVKRENSYDYVTLCLVLRCSLF